jgi:hypothetical protein
MLLKNKKIKVSLLKVLLQVLVQQLPQEEQLVLLIKAQLLEVPVEETQEEILVEILEEIQEEVITRILELQVGVPLLGVIKQLEEIREEQRVEIQEQPEE